MPDAPRNLREYISRIEGFGELSRVAAEVSPELEITEIARRGTDKNVYPPGSGGPGLLFESVAGSDFPVAINLFASERRMAAACGGESLDGVASEIEGLTQLERPEGLVDKLRFLGLLHKLSSYMPKTVSSAPCQEVVETENPSLDGIPILKCWPEDAGRYITLGVVFTKDPETGKQNAGMYRLQIFDEETFGCHWQPHHDGARNWRAHAERGEPMDVAVAVGCAPAMTYASTAPLPPNVEETLLAGFLMRSPVEMVRAKTVDLLVPAESEFVFEGRVAPEKLRLEGPFGDHTGHYTPPAEYPFAKLTAVTRRREPIYQTTVVGHPPMEDFWLGKATERIFLPLLRMLLPEIVDLALPDFGIFHNWAFVSIKKRYPHHARKVMHALWGMGQMMLMKFIVIVDEDIDVQDTAAVLFRLGQNVDPARDCEPAVGPADVLDHAGAATGSGTKMGFDATRKLPEESGGRKWPEEIGMSEEIIRRVTERWEEYGLGGGDQGLGDGG